jgi:hypothetical protein
MKSRSNSPFFTPTLYCLRPTRVSAMSGFDRRSLAVKLYFHWLSISRLLLACLLGAFACWGCQAKSGEIPFDTFVIDVAVADKIAIPVEVAMPKLSTPRALVVVLPGTLGYADPYIEAEMHKTTYNADSRGGLTDSLVGAGYAVAFYSQRGHKLPRDCVRGKNLAERASNFVKECIDQKVSASVTLTVVTDDTAAVFAALSAHPRVGSLAQLVLTTSEGIHHASLLAGRGRIKPLGIVSVGGPLESLGYTAWYQGGNRYYLKLTELAFEKCNRATLSTQEIVSCAGAVRPEGLVAKLDRVFGGSVVQRGELAARWEYWNVAYTNTVNLFLSLPEGAITTGYFAGGYEIPIAGASRYYAQMYGYKSSSVEHLKSFKGKVVYLFGEAETQVALPLSPKCIDRESNAVATFACRTEILPGLAHGLQDGTWLPTKTALERIVNALNEVGEVSEGAGSEPRAKP